MVVPITGMGSLAWGAHEHGSPMVHRATKRYNLNFITKCTIVMIFSQGNGKFYNFIGHIIGVQQHNIITLCKYKA
jgi:hypothetical protein